MKRNPKTVLLALWLAMALLLSSFALADSVYGDFTYVLNEEGQAVIIHYGGRDQNVELPWNIQGKIVAEIGAEAFAGNTSIKTVKLPIGVTVIRESAFRDCTNLTHVELPSRLETIEDGAFLGCTALKELEIPESVAELGEECFASWTKLTGNENSLAGAYANAVGLDYGETVQATPAPVDTSAYYRYKIRNGGAVITSYLGQESTVVIPSSLGGYPVRAIGEDAFSSCYSAERVIVPEGVTELENVSFRYCTALLEIQLPSTLRRIGENAFYRCERLEEIEIPEGVTEIGNKAFRGCLQLRRATLPQSLKTIPWYTFFECHARLTIYAPKGSAAEKFAGQLGYKFVAQ